MSDQPDHNRQVRQVVLPSGRTIEVVYFQDAPEEVAASTLPAPACRQLDDLHVCARCTSTLVFPLEWREAGPSHWEVSLRCPNCEWSETGVYEQDAVERFDAELDRGTESLVRDMQSLSRANMEDSIERFITALAEDHVLPADF